MFAVNLASGGVVGSLLNRSMKSSWVFSFLNTSIFLLVIYSLSAPRLFAVMLAKPLDSSPELLESACVYSIEFPSDKHCFSISLRMKLKEPSFPVGTRSGDGPFSRSMTKSRCSRT